MVTQTVIICDSEASNTIITKALNHNDFEIAFNSTSVDQLLINCELQRPDLIVISLTTTYPGLLDQLKVINQQYPLPIVIFSQDERDDTIENAIKAGVSAYVVDGLRENRIMPILRTAIARFEYHHAVQQELTDLKATLSERKVIDRAKGLIMEQRRCSEQEAYTLLRSTAMSQNVRIAELAQNIINAAQLLNPAQ